MQQSLASPPLWSVHQMGGDPLQRRLVTMGPSGRFELAQQASEYSMWTRAVCSQTCDIILVWHLQNNTI